MKVFRDLILDLVVLVLEVTSWRQLHSNVLLYIGILLRLDIEILFDDL